jgi:hypothetical protein
LLVATAAEQNDILRYHFGDVHSFPILAVIAARLQPALDVDLFSLGEVLCKVFLAVRSKNSTALNLLAP